MKKNVKVIIAVIFVVVTAIAFYGGMKYGSSSQPAVAQNGQFNRSGSGSGRFGNGNVPASGQVISKDSQGLTIQLRDGSSRIIILSSSTSVMKSANGTLDDISQGNDVTVIGQQNSDGSVTAQSIQIRPTQPTQQVQ